MKQSNTSLATEKMLDLFSQAPTDSHTPRKPESDISTPVERSDVRNESQNFEGSRFDGADYVHERDAPRLTGQIKRVYDVMRDGKWRTLAAIDAAIRVRFGKRDPEASISAQLRHLRKERFGSHTVEREHLGNGLYLYRLKVDA